MSTPSFFITKAGMLSDMTVTSKPMSRHTVAVSLAPWKYGLVSGQKSFISLPTLRHSRSIIPTIVSAKQNVMTVPFCGIFSTKKCAMRSIRP